MTYRGFGARGHAPQKDATKKRIQALAAGVIGAGNTVIEVRPDDWRNVISYATREFEKRDYRCAPTPGFYHTRVDAVKSLIADVHSPFDFPPVHTRWDVVY